MRINPSIIHYVTESIIVFVSGCNVILYDFNTKEQKFLLRGSKQSIITSVSVGNSKSQQNKFDLTLTRRKAYYTQTNFNVVKSELKDKVICIGEYSITEECFYVTAVKPFASQQSKHNGNNHFNVKSNEKLWKINFCTTLNNTNYCVALSQKKSNSKKNPILSRISFIKYTTETFISQETIPEELIYCCYNPKNSIELVLCGKGYLRLWNVFINEGTLKEHQQRFLNSKQEKEQNFIKAQFFDKKPFLLIVGTTENIFYIIDSFQVIHELSTCYSFENIYDLNVQNFQNLVENEEIGNLQEEVDNLTVKDLDDKLKEINDLTNIAPKKKVILNSEGNNNESLNKSPSHSEEKKQDQESDDSNDVFKRLYISKEKNENDAKLNKNNTVKYFELISDNLLLIIYANDGCSLIYKIDWNKKIGDDGDELEFRKWKVADCQVIRFAKNIKTILGFSMYKQTNDIIVTVESYESEYSKKKTSISLFKLKKTTVKKKKETIHSINFEFELFNGYFEDTQIKYLDLCENMQIIYYIDKDNNLNCFDHIKNKYTIKHHFPEEIYSFSANSINNLVAIAFSDKVNIYGKLKDKMHLYCELDVADSMVKWSTKGDKLIICGLNRNPNKPKSYCLYFVDSVRFNTIHVFENLISKTKDIKFVDEDKYLFCMLKNSNILGIYLNIFDYRKSYHELLERKNENIATNYMKLIFTHNSRGKDYIYYDYDEKLQIVVALDSDNKMYLIPDFQKNDIDIIELNSNNLINIKLIKELKVLIGGDNNGTLRIYNWPLKGYENLEENKNININLNDSLLNYINLDVGNVSSLINYKNYSAFITLTDSRHVLISQIHICKNHEFKPLEYFSKPTKPQIEEFMQIYDLYEMSMEEIANKEKNMDILNDAMEKIKEVMEEAIDEIQNSNQAEVQNMENNIIQNVENEKIKLESIKNDINKLKKEMTSDTEKKVTEMTEEQEKVRNKNDNKLRLYNNEINRLKTELDNIKTKIKSECDLEAETQTKIFDDMVKEYNVKFNQLKEDTQKSLLKLVNISTEYDEATAKIVEDYKVLVTNLDDKLKKMKEINTKIIIDKEEKLMQAKNLEDQHKKKLEEKVKESDKLIEKNVDIKQSIINATQRTITFQEQLLETEKNLVKIDKKLKDLVVKNKHLEQIRFVLEHRMTSLEKEKSPLEGQCAFLENQKNKLTEEFNKIIMQINKNNQELENKQSQLRTSLIQNYEVHDQKNYVEAKLNQLKIDLEQFLMNYQEGDEEKPLMESKATYVALNFKKFYDKYFSIPIEEELLNYQYYSQKLKEQTDKDGIANNFDLIMRNKAEEKLICEKDKIDELVDVREKGFRRIQNENTILISECNRLRKNLHEIYMHVIDIEQRFESLTKINPKLSKNDIVRQIKEFIKTTHEKIKTNYAKTKKRPKSKGLPKLKTSKSKMINSNANNGMNIPTEVNFGMNRTQYNNASNSRRLSKNNRNNKWVNKININAENSPYANVIKNTEYTGRKDRSSFLSSERGIFGQSSGIKKTDSRKKILPALK